ncbi:MAG: hypothetical protein HC888_15970 [Candidatus Competibacteraceae bacterium]|nr:hypothetical protein [Candidatus Competibacteraceae bacterium]
MSAKRLFAIGFIYICTLIAWMILGAANLDRTDSSFSKLSSEVRILFGGPVSISSPKVYYKKPVRSRESSTARRSCATPWSRCTWRRTRPIFG